MSPNKNNLEGVKITTEGASSVESPQQVFLKALSPSKNCKGCGVEMAESPKEESKETKVEYERSDQKRYRETNEYTKGSPLKERKSYGTDLHKEIHLKTPTKAEYYD